MYLSETSAMWINIVRGMRSFISMGRCTGAAGRTCKSDGSTYVWLPRLVSWGARHANRGLVSCKVSFWLHPKKTWTAEVGLTCMHACKVDYLQCKHQRLWQSLKMGGGDAFAYWDWTPTGRDARILSSDALRVAQKLLFSTIDYSNYVDSHTKLVGSLILCKMTVASWYINRNHTFEKAWELQLLCLFFPHVSGLRVFLGGSSWGHNHI